MQIIRNSSFARFLVFAFGDFAPPAIQLAMLPIYTAFLSPSDLGIVATVSAIHAMLNRLSNLGFEWVLLSKYLAREDSNSRGSLAGTLLSLSLAVRLLLVAAVILIVRLSSISFTLPISDSLRPGIYVLCGVFLIESALTFFYTITKLERRAIQMSAAQVLGAVITCTTAVLLLRNGYEVIAIFYSQLVGAAVQLTLALPVLYGRVRFKWDADAVVQLQQIGLPALPQGICTYFGKFSDQLVILAVFGSGPLGLYYLALRLCQGFTVLYSTFLSTVIGDVSRKAQQTNHAPQLIRWGLLATMGVSALQLPMILFSSEFFRGLTSAEFHTAHRLAAVLLVLPSISGLVMYCNSILVCAGRTRAVSFISMAMNLSLAVLLWAAAEWCGLFYVPLALILGNGLWLIFLVRRLYDQFSYKTAELSQFIFLFSVPAVAALIALGAPSLQLFPKLCLLMSGYAAMFGVDCMNRKFILEFGGRLLQARRPLVQQSV